MNRLSTVCTFLLCALAAWAEAPALRGFVIGRAEDPTRLTANADGSFTVAGTGRDADTGRDEGAMGALETEAPAFTFTARIAKVEGMTATTLCGLGMRPGPWGADKAVHLAYDNREDRRGLRWFLRFASRPRDDEGALRCYAAGVLPAVTNPEGLWLRLVRRYPRVEMAWSADGTTWTPVPYRAALLAPKVLVGLQVTAGGDSTAPVIVTYDHVSFAVDAAETDSPDHFGDYAPKTPTWRYCLAKAQGAKGPFSAFLMMPKDMPPAGIRAILFTPGNKEVMLAGRVKLAYDSAGPLRKPHDMPDYEGAWDLEGLRPFYQGLAAHGIVRVGGVFGGGDYGKAIERLAAVSGIAHLPNVPVLATGGDCTGIGPERCIAALGGPGADPTVPGMTVFGTHDGGGLRGMMAAIPGNRARHALWACVPMWTIGHKPCQSEAMVWPFFTAAMRLRLPADADPTRGPVALRALREEDGWLGLADTWETNDPTAVSWGDAKATGNLVWLMDEAQARTWQAGSANHPRTVIQFPTFDGNASFDNTMPEYWHNSTVRAGAPLEIVASGPLGKNVKVEYLEGNRTLKVVKPGPDPYRVTLESLTPGPHTIHAVSIVDGVREVSKPVLVTAVGIAGPAARVVARRRPGDGSDPLADGVGGDRGDREGSPR
jgi:hypothetical protein